MKISAAIIVRNEERTLARCLSSIREHVDEIVVVDTGSTDLTPHIARQFTDRVFERPWRRDFAEARQYAFDRASGDWVFWVDADDVVVNADRIRASIDTAGDKAKALYWKYVVARDQYGNSTCEFWRERCVLNDGSFRWVGRVHEVLVPQGHYGTARVDDVVVMHLREPKADRSPTRNLSILQEELQRSGRHPPARLLLCLANEHADLGDTARALDFLSRYLRVSTWDDEKYFAQLAAARLYRGRQQFGEAIDIALQAVKTVPFWPNAYLSLAETYYFQQQWDRVVHWIDIGRERQPPDTICIVNPREYRYDWIVHYTNALYHLGRVEEALEWSQKALAICPTDTWHTLNWHFFSESVRQAQLENPAAGRTPPATLPTVFWQGPLFDPSGYAEEGRQFVLAIDGAGDRVRAVPFFQWNLGRAALTASDLASLNRLICTPTQRGERVVSIVHLPADHFHRIPGAALHVGRTMCETDRIPLHWVPLCNSMDQIWVPSEFNVQTFAQSGVERHKLVKIPEAVDTDLFRPDVEPLGIEGARGFTFLSIFEWGLRKGWDVLLRAFVEEFGAADDVSLVFKTGAAGGRSLDEVRAQAADALRDAGGPRQLPANVVFHYSTLSAAEMPRLYRAADAFALPSRGEGWGRPLQEAMLMGLPTIATRWSGHLEFMNDENSWLLECQIVDVPAAGWREAAIYQGHRWAEPDRLHLRRVLREVFENREAARSRGAVARHHILSRYSRAAVARLVHDHLVNSLRSAPPAPSREHQHEHRS